MPEVRARKTSLSFSSVKIPSRVKLKALDGRIRFAGRKFDTPALKDETKIAGTLTKLLKN